jgi:recombination protein RecA
MSKQETLKRIVDAVRKQFGEGAALTMGDGMAGRSEVSEVVPTGILPVDHYVFGCGGLPVGRLVEVYSEEGVGKTSFAMAAVAGAQREGGLAMWIETEEALDRTRFTVFGADREQVALLQPGSIEQCGETMELSLKTIPKGVGPNLLVWDSIAATPTQREVDEGLSGGDRVGERARVLSKMCRSLLRLAAERRTALLFINQVREKIGVMFGDKYTTPGGHGVKFHASVRLQLFGGKSVKDGDEHTGKTITFLGAKNRMAPPWRKAQVRLDYAKGWDNQWSVLNHAKDKGLVADNARGEKHYLDALDKLGWKSDPPA